MGDEWWEAVLCTLCLPHLEGLQLLLLPPGKLLQGLHIPPPEVSLRVPRSAPILGQPMPRPRRLALEVLPSTVTKCATASSVEV
jgi:hypothetical protein